MVSSNKEEECVIIECEGCGQLKRCTEIFGTFRCKDCDHKSLDSIDKNMNLKYGNKIDNAL